MASPPPSLESLAMAYPPPSPPCDADCYTEQYILQIGVPVGVIAFLAICCLCYGCCSTSPDGSAAKRTKSAQAAATAKAKALSAGRTRSKESPEWRRQPSAEEGGASAV